MTGSRAGAGRRPALGRAARLEDVVRAVLADHRPPVSALEVGAASRSAVLRGVLTDVTSVEVTDPRAPLGPLPGRFDLVVCVDVLADLPDPDAGLRELARASSRHLLLCVPHEPFARAGTLLTGRPPHRNRWTGAGFQRFVSQVAAVRQVASPYPWTVVWAVTA